MPLDDTETETQWLDATRSAVNTLGRVLGEMRALGSGAFDDDLWSVLNSRMYAPLQAAKLLRILYELEEPPRL